MTNNQLNAIALMLLIILGAIVVSAVYLTIRFNYLERMILSGFGL